MFWEAGVFVHMSVTIQCYLLSNKQAAGLFYLAVRGSQ